MCLFSLFTAIGLSIKLQLLHDNYYIISLFEIRITKEGHY